MRKYFNPTAESFRNDLNKPIYVDKSLLISVMNKCIQEGRANIAVTRPYGFGKTSLAKMLCAYYTSGDDSKSLFDGLRISKDKSYLSYLNKFNVLYLNPMDFVGQIDNKGNPIEAMISSAIDEIKSVYKDIEVRWKDNLYEYIKCVYNKTGLRFAIIIDEYDFLIRKYPENKRYQEEYLYFLNSIFKASDSSSYIALAYLTGILPMMKSETQAKLNHFRNVSMLSEDEFFEFIGFNDEEVKDLCDGYGVSYEKIKLWYGGYVFGDKHESYCPNDVIHSVLFRRLEDFGANSSSRETIEPFIRSNKFKIRDEISFLIAGESVVIKPSDFNNTLEGIKSRDAFLTYLTHLGYLTYKGGNILGGKKLGYVKIPNYGIRQKFSKMIAKDDDYSSINSIIEKSSKLLEKTMEGDENYVAKEIQETHLKYSSAIKFNDENSLSCVLTLAYFSLQGTYRFYREWPSGKGFANMVFIPVDSSKPAFLFELKYDKNVKTAFNQILEKNYPLGLDKYKGNIIVVGINYDKKTKKHYCIIKKV